MYVLSVKDSIKPGFKYHLYNHANGSMSLFLKPGNYQYFMDKYKHYVHKYVDTYAYCLMPNHFHFIFNSGQLILSKHKEKADNIG